jgi:aspartate racemase
MQFNSKDSMHSTEWTVAANLLLACCLVATPAEAVDQGQSAQLPPAADMKTLGLVGGTSWYSTIDYYRYINEAINDAYGNSTNPPLILYNMDQEHIHVLQAKGEWDKIASLIIEASLRLRGSGAQAILFCANTPHKVYAEVARKIDIPILHIGDATGAAIQTRGLKKVGLIGTLYTMEDGFMTEWLKDRYSIETLVPNTASARQELHRIVHQELSRGILKPESKRYILQQIDDLLKRGAQGIILGCTEFPLIIKPSDVGVPVFDTTRLHSRMAVDFVIGKRDLAHVRAAQ